MAFRKLLFLVSIVVLIIFAKFTLSDGALHAEDSPASALQPEDDSVSRSKAAELRLHQLKLKISSLETSIEDQTGELGRKDESVKELERLIEEKLYILTSLQTKLPSFQGSLDVERKEDTKTRIDELEKQVVNLRREIEAQNKKKVALEARVNAAEQKIKELNLKLENLRRINDQQKSRIHKTQHALEVAEEEMLKAKLEASSVTKQLKEVDQAWLPPWLSAHLVHGQSFVLAHWNKFGGPAINQSIQKVFKGLELKYEIENRVQHYLEIMKSKWFPTIKEQCNSIVDNFYPLVQSFSAQAIDYYQLAQSMFKSHIVNMVETITPYFQEAKMVMMPFVDHISEITKPHFDKVQLFLRPYPKEVVHCHRKVTQNVRIYHSLVQAALYETLNSYEFTKPFATEGLVWFMASILMAFPVIILFRTLLLRDPKRRHHNTRRIHNRRRPRRGH